jgi:cytosine/adenosine deaminase-related metal-dependent hydrolase
VYKEDGLLNHRPILAHCIWMGGDEWSMVRDSGSVVAHCPTSNAVLGSGVMRLEEVKRRGIPYAICTDVGASPTTSMLCEMAEFLRDHAGLHPTATAEEALYRSTLAPAEILGVDERLGSFEVGKPLSFIEIEPAGTVNETSAEEVIRRHLLEIDPEGWPPHADVRKRLAAEGLDPPRDMDTLAADAEATVAKLDRKVRRVVMDGKPLWNREGLR